MAKSSAPPTNQHEGQHKPGEMTAQDLAMLQQFTHHTMQQTLLETQQWQAKMATKMAAFQQFVDFTISADGTNFPSVCKKIKK